MTDADLIAAIRKIIRTRPRKSRSMVEADLARYDQIAGLVGRHSPDAPPRALRPRRTDAVATTGGKVTVTE